MDQKKFSQLTKNFETNSKINNNTKPNNKFNKNAPNIRNDVPKQDDSSSNNNKIWIDPKIFNNKDQNLKNINIENEVKKKEQLKGSENTSVSNKSTQEVKANSNNTNKEFKHSSTISIKDSNNGGSKKKSGIEQLSFSNLVGTRADSCGSLIYNKIINDNLQENEEERKYSNNNIEKGKKFFKDRYIQEKIYEIDSTIKRLTVTRGLKIEDDTKDKNEPNRLSLKGTNETNNMYEKESEIRKCQTEYLLIVEKAIISFNIKKYKESYKYLENSGIIKNLREFGEFLLVVSGFDKIILGEFLAKEKPPNENKDIINSFINSIYMDYKHTKFLDCLRFLLKRLVLPKDANLILVIMDKFSENFFETNKNDKKFISIFKNPNAIYLLVSTILALNTMFTRKDIKNMNVIKKEEFKNMNHDIDSDYVDRLYDELKNEPISLSDDYNEEIYRKLATLVQEKNKEDLSSKNLDTYKRGITSDINDKTTDSKNSNGNNKDNVEGSNGKDGKKKTLKKHNTERVLEQQYYEFVQDCMDLDIVRKTLRNSYNRKKSFSMNTNLLSFNKEDKELLTKKNKFYKIVGSSTPILREYIVTEDFKRLAFDKTLDVNKQKYKKYIEISDINDVYIGIDHGDNIKKYIKAFPQEEKLVNNFISIVYNNRKEQLDIKTDDLSLALLWYKALKSLVIQTKTKENEQKIKNELSKQNEIKEKIEGIWDDYIFPSWNNYGRFIIIKRYERSNLFHSILIQPERMAKIDLLEDKKNLNFKTIEEFLKEIEERLSKNSSKLEYHEFFCLCYLGIPHKLRKKLWKIFIENDLGLTNNTYNYYKENLTEKNIQFYDFESKYRENPNFQINPDFTLNQMIIDIINSRYLFIQEINEQELKENELMQEVYNITRIINLIRNDIPYNRGIVSIAYLFLLVGLDEEKSFICLINLIFSGNIFKYYMGDKEFIDKNIEFFKKLLKSYSEKVYDHLNNLEINPELYLIPWFERLFTTTLDYEILLHVFDLYIFNGEYILFQTAITIIKLLEEELLNLTISEVFKVMKRLPKKYTEAEFFEKFKNYNCIRDEYITWNKNNLLSVQQKQIEQIIKK